MGESRTLIDGQGVEYTGLISVNGLYKTTMSWLDEHGYGPYDGSHSEQVFPQGKQIEITINGAKKLSDFAKVEWGTSFEFSDLQEMIVEKEGKKVTMSKGYVKVSTNIYLTTDMDKTEEQTAFQYFLRVIIDKFFFKSYISKAEGKAKKDYAMFESILKSFLNMEKFR